MNDSRERLPCRRCGKPIAPALHQPGAIEKGICVSCRRKAGAAPGGAGFQGAGGHFAGEQWGLPRGVSGRLPFEPDTAEVGE